jgi:argininosuccinate synthase
VSGTIRLKLFKGDCRIVGRKSPHAMKNRPAAHDDSQTANRLAIAGGTS